MADSEQPNPDSEAKKWFMLALIGTFLFGLAAFNFVILADVGPQEIPVEAAEHGQPD